MFEGWSFTDPYAALWGLAGLIFWLVDYIRIGKKAELVVPPKQAKGITRLNISKIPVLLIGVVAWALIAFSLTGVRKPIGKSNAEKEINDIYFVIDVSRSMLVEDFQPNRLEAAKNNIRRFVELSPVDRIGIIMFADKVFTLIPATQDLELVKQSVDQIRIGFLGSGTNIGDALGLAIARSKGSIAQNKSIVLLTDGASNVGLISPEEAAKRAKENNIKVHTIGIGGDPNAKLATGNGIFGKRYSKVPGGSMDFKTLEEISKISGGQSFIAANKNALGEVLETINKLERKKIEVKGRVIYEELYLKYLILGAMILFLLELFRRAILREAQ